MGSSAAARNNLSAYWMPFTPNRAFKAAPRLIASAEGQLYVIEDGRRIRDGFSGRLCGQFPEGQHTTVRIW